MHPFWLHRSPKKDIEHRFYCGFGGGNLRTIDADLFKNNVKTWAENIRDFREDNKCFFTEENILKAIDDQPTVETVNDGKWLPLDTNLIEGYNCSVCGHIVYMTEYGQKIRTKYCANCGAKMNEVKSND